MRWLFLLLLVINLGVFLWGYQREMNMARLEPVPKPGVGNLRLWSEVKTPEVIAKAPQIAEAPEPEKEVVTEEAPVIEVPAVAISEPEPEPEPEKVVRLQPASACFNLGDLEKQDVAEAIAKMLAAQDIEAVIQDELVRKEAGYWVVIPPFPTDDQAQRRVRDLKAAGIRDVWRFTGGEKKNAISLGLFSNRPNAEKVQKNAKAKGFNPQVQPRYRDDRRYWLEFTGLQGQPLPDELQQQLQSDYPDLEITPRTCP